MEGIRFYSTNNKSERVTFETALMKGLASGYGLYMVAREDIPKLASATIKAMKDLSYPQIAFEVLYPLLKDELREGDLRGILEDAYDESEIPTTIQHITGKTYIMWLSHGPTSSFKDYAARFFARTLNYFLRRSGQKRVVIVATSGDTGGAVADALHNLENVDNIVFFPQDSISERQRRQMTTLKDNVYALALNGNL